MVTMCFTSRRALYLRGATAAGFDSVKGDNSNFA